MGCYGTAKSSWRNALHPLVLSYTRNPPPLGCALLLINTQLNARQHAFTLCNQLPIVIPALMQRMVIRNQKKLYQSQVAVIKSMAGCQSGPGGDDLPAWLLPYSSSQLPFTKYTLEINFRNTLLKKLGPGLPSAGGPRMDRRVVTSPGVLKVSCLRHSATNSSSG